KNCPICRREYPDLVQFCTRDGTKLQSDKAFKYCPECSAQYPADVQKCPAHNLELIALARPINAGINHCVLCNKYYPQAIECCPVHGISFKPADWPALEATENNEAVKPSDAEQQEPLVAVSAEQVAEDESEPFKPSTPLVEDSTPRL